MFRRVDGDAIEGGVSAKRAEEWAPPVPEILQTEEPELTAAAKVRGKLFRVRLDGAGAVRPAVASVPAPRGIECLEVPGVNGRELGVAHLLEVVPSVPPGQRSCEVRRLDSLADQLADEPIHRREESFEVPEPAEEAGGALADQAGEKGAAVELGQRPPIGPAQPRREFRKVKSGGSYQPPTPRSKARA